MGELNPSFPVYPEESVAQALVPRGTIAWGRFAIVWVTLHHPAKRSVNRGVSMARQFQHFKQVGKEDPTNLSNKILAISDDEDVHIVSVAQHCSHCLISRVARPVELVDPVILDYCVRCSNLRIVWFLVVIDLIESRGKYSIVGRVPLSHLVKEPPRRGDASICQGIISVTMNDERRGTFSRPASKWMQCVVATNIKLFVDPEVMLGEWHSNPVQVSKLSRLVSLARSRP